MCYLGCRSAQHEPSAEVERDAVSEVISRKGWTVLWIGTAIRWRWRWRRDRMARVSIYESYEPIPTPPTDQRPPPNGEHSAFYLDSAELDGRVSPLRTSRDAEAGLRVDAESVDPLNGLNLFHLATPSAARREDRADY